MRSALCLPRQLSRRSIASSLARRTFGTTLRSNSSQFGSGPAPPRLPKEEQEIFEDLQRRSTGAFSTPRPQINQSPDSTATSASTSTSPASRINQSPDSGPEDGVEIRIEGGSSIRDGEEVHPNMRRGAPPEFEGDVNPKTGEVGGPKNEPLRWGSSGDYSYNGRVTDF